VTGALNTTARGDVGRARPQDDVIRSAQPDTSTSAVRAPSGKPLDTSVLTEADLSALAKRDLGREPAQAEAPCR
jgi:hypothetical protein